MARNKQHVHGDSPARYNGALSRQVESQQTWWREQWLAFPTVREADGGLDFWAVPEDTGVYQDDWPRGERLAEETIAHMRRFPEGSSVLRRILSRLDYQSTVAQGFLNHLEETLAQPQLHPAQAAQTRVPRPD